MYSNQTFMKDEPCPNLITQDCPRQPQLLDSPKKRSSPLPTLLLYIKRQIAKFSEHFLRCQNTTQKSIQQSPNSCNHEPATENQHSQQSQRSKRFDRVLHLRLRQAECDQMPKRIVQDAQEEPRHDNYHRQIVAFADDFLLQVPPDHIFYQLTIHCRRDTQNHTAYKVERVADVMNTVYKRLCETFVHKRSYHQDPHKHLMPHLLAIIEFEENVLFHAHCLLAVHPLLADQFDQLTIYDKFHRFDDRITQSHFNRTIADANNIKAFDEPTKVSKWLNYMMKRNRNPFIPKTPDHVVLRRPL
jgi:hypothetical protein